MMQKISANKIALGVVAVAIIGFGAYWGVVLYHTTKANEQETKALSAATITAADVAPYLTGVVMITCQDSGGNAGGSGSLWDLPNLGYTVLTNEHVIKADDTTGKNQGVVSGFNKKGVPLITQNACSVSLSTDTTANDGNEYYINLAGKYQWNKDADAADLPIHLNTGDDTITSSTLPVSDLNYSISNVRLCPTTIPVGSPVADIGYPSFGAAATGTPDTTPQSYEITTTGIISGIVTNDTETGVSLAYPDFLVSALIDSGSSGGIAFAKDSNGLCVLGLPTKLIEGDYNDEGIVQNIRNIFLQG